MTDPDFRNQGLNRLIMEQVLKDWEDKIFLIYLYANPSVLEFYPKFGFVKANEFVHYRPIISENKLTASFKKMDMNKRKTGIFSITISKTPELTQSWPFARIAI